MNSKADFYFTKEKKWQKEIEKLRSIILGCHLKEELKWGCPCYMFEQSNIVLIHVFKEYCALLFFKGVLLSDPQGVLIQQTEQVQSARQMRFTGLGQIEQLAAAIQAYIYEAVAVEEKGLKVSLKKTKEYPVPEEFQKRMDLEPALKQAFGALTPGRQRGYLLHFSAPKQSKTRESRIEKSRQDIMDGKGLND